MINYYFIYKCCGHTPGHNHLAIIIAFDYLHYPLISHIIVLIYLFYNNIYFILVDIVSCLFIYIQTSKHK